MKTKPTQKVRTGVMYIRESTEEQGNGYSPDAQRQGMLEYAREHNIKVVHEYIDLLSGRREDRPQFQQMFDDAEAGKFDVVLVYKTSRFARNRRVATEYKDKIRKMGVQVIFTSENLGTDPNDPNASMMEGVHEIFDEQLSNQISAWTRDGFKTKRQKGYLNGRPPLGYYREKGDPENIYVDKAKAKLVKEIYEMYASGMHSLQDIAIKMNENGHTTILGNPFTYSSIKCILQNRAYLGVVPAKKPSQVELPGQHKAIISEELFDRVQMQFESRRNTKGRPTAQHRFYLLQGLVYCHRCRKYLQGKESAPANTKMLPTMYCQTQCSKKYGERNYYACKFKRENKSCKQKAVYCDVIDKQVLKFMSGMQVPEDVIKEITERLGRLYDVYQGEQPLDNTNQIADLEKKLDKLNHMYLNTESISREDYDKRVHKIQDEMEQLGKKEKRYKQLSKKKLMEITEFFLRNIPLMMSKGKISEREKREWIMMTIKRIWVKDKKVIAIEPHDDYKFLFVSTSKVLSQRPLAAPKRNNPRGLFLCGH